MFFFFWPFLDVALGAGMCWMSGAFFLKREREREGGGGGGRKKEGQRDSKSSRGKETER